MQGLIPIVWESALLFIPSGLLCLTQMDYCVYPKWTIGDY